MNGRPLTEEHIDGPSMPRRLVPGRAGGRPFRWGGLSGVFPVGHRVRRSSLRVLMVYLVAGVLAGPGCGTRGGPTCAVKGTIVAAESGLPVAGSLAMFGFRSDLVDALESHPPGLKTGAAHSSEFSEEIESPGEAFLNVGAPGREILSLWVECDGAKRHSLGMVPLRREAVLAGRVFDSEGVPRVGVEVTVKSMVRNDWSLGTTVTRTDGTFRIGHMPPGAVFVLADFWGIPSQGWVDVDLKEGEESSVALGGRARIRGRLLRGDGRPAPSGETILVSPVGDPRWPAHSLAAGGLRAAGIPRRGIYTAQQGWFECPGLEKGLYFVGTPEAYRFVESPGVDGPVVEVDLTPLTMTGGVRFEDDVFDRSFRVTILKDGALSRAIAMDAEGWTEVFAAASRKGGEARRGANGQFSAEVPGPGAYEIAVQCEGGGTVEAVPAEVKMFGGTCDDPLQVRPLGGVTIQVCHGSVIACRREDGRLLGLTLGVPRLTEEGMVSLVTLFLPPGKRKLLVFDAAGGIGEVEVDVPASGIIDCGRFPGR